MEIYTLSKAKLRMGRLVEQALQGEPVVIRKGNRLVQLTEYVVPEPIPERPVGYFRRRADDYRAANAAPANLPPPTLTMHQWEIVRVRLNAKDRDAHPAVVISCEEDCLDPEMLRINVLYGSKRAPAASLAPWQVHLNSADGLEFATAVDCGLFYLVEKSACSPAVGQVSLERRRQIGRIICEVLRLPR